MHLELLKQDLLRWCDAEKKSYSLISAIRLWMKYDEFKCLVNYRLKSTKMSKFCKIFSRAEKRHNLYIYADYVGGGFMPFHAFSTIIHAKSLGRNCTIFQNVTIGYWNGDKPTIGDNVTVYAGAVIIGGIYIGDNVEIGANAVVTKNIPANTIVAGVPAKIIKYKDC